MSKASDGTCCEKCGKRLQFREARWVLDGGGCVCLDCMPAMAWSEPTAGSEEPVELRGQCSRCGKPIRRGDAHTVKYQSPEEEGEPTRYCEDCAPEPCPTDTCGICEADCGDDEECGEIRNGDRAVHVCGKCFDVWEYIRDMAAEGTGHVGGAADPPLTYGNESAARRPQELSAREKRIGKLADDAITGSGEK